jgi:hypothetical protein
MGVVRGLDSDETDRWDGGGMRTKSKLVVGISLVAAVALGIGMVAVVNLIVNAPTQYAITYRVSGLTGEEMVRYNENVYSEGFLVNTYELRETKVAGKSGEMRIEAIVTEGDKAALTVDSADPSAVTCSIVQDEGDAKLERVVADTGSTTRNSVHCEALLD